MTEIKKETFLDFVRSMMSYFDLPKFLWEYALEIMAYILNSVITNSFPNIPVELWTSWKASKQHYKIWGCLTYVLKEKTGKLDTKLELCFLVEYPKGTKG